MAGGTAKMRPTALDVTSQEQRLEQLRTKHCEATAANEARAQQNKACFDTALESSSPKKVF